ncbi:MAG: hypothetical protein WAN74_06755 [Thermoplasmata archaeon]
MTEELPVQPRTLRIEGLGLLAVGAAIAVGLGIWDPHGGLEGIAIAVAGFAAAGALRAFAGRNVRPFEFLPAVAALGYLALVVPTSIVTNLLAGVSALALFVWLVDDPELPRGNLRRSGDVLLLPALGLAVALSSSLLIQPGYVYVGVAAGLLVGGLLAVAWVLSHPETFDTPDAPTI